MKYLIVLSLLIVGCGQQYDNGPAGVTVTGTQKCATGECYSYLLNDCCPDTAPYACGNGCYTYSGGGGCSSYKTQCY